MKYVDYNYENILLDVRATTNGYSLKNANYNTSIETIMTTGYFEKDYCKRDAILIKEFRFDDFTAQLVVDSWLKYLKKKLLSLSLN